MPNKQKSTESNARLFIILFVIFIFISAMIREYLIIKIIIMCLFAIFFFLKKDTLLKTKSYKSFAKFVGVGCLIVGLAIFIPFLVGLSRGHEFGAEWILPLLMSVFFIVVGIIYIVKIRRGDYRYL